MATRNAGSAGDALTRVLSVVRWLEDALLALVLGAMVILAPLQIFLRDFFDTGIAWGDPMLRVLVLWVGMLGAIAASRDRRHITIDALSRILPERARDGTTAVTSLFTASVCAVVAWHAGRFVLSEYEFGSTAFSGVPAWLLASVIPIAFGSIGVRYLLRCAVDLLAAIHGRSADEAAT